MDKNITSFLGLIQRRLPESTLEEHSESFGFISSAVQQLRTLVADIKVFTKVRTMSPDPEIIVVFKFIGEVYPNLAVEPKSIGHVSSWEIPTITDLSHAQGNGRVSDTLLRL